MFVCVYVYLPIFAHLYKYNYKILSKRMAKFVSKEIISFLHSDQQYMNVCTYLPILLLCNKLPQI